MRSAAPRPNWNIMVRVRSDCEVLKDARYSEFGSKDADALYSLFAAYSCYFSYNYLHHDLTMAVDCKCGKHYDRYFDANGIYLGRYMGCIHKNSPWISSCFMLVGC